MFGLYLYELCSLLNARPVVLSFATVSRLATRSPSLDLVWPESPSQPSSTAGQPGQLSPTSSQFMTLSAADLRVSRQLAVKLACRQYTDRSSRAVDVAENSVITVNRQAKRSVHQNTALIALLIGFLCFYDRF